MRIAVFDGDPRGFGTPLDRAIVHFVAEAEARGDSVERVNLRDHRFFQCVGCFDCWLRTPGRCRLRDDGDRLVAAIVDVDLLVFASPLIMGFTSALLKRANDRLLPFLLPYIRVVDGECHHLMRYGHGLDLALLLERGDATDAELEATLAVYRRFVKNIDGKLAWVREAAEKEGGLRALDAA
jgi:multimeric flavodoxin WrbA